MAILRVNVRPAAKFRQISDTQGGESERQETLTKNNLIQITESAAQISATEPNAGNNQTEKMFDASVAPKVPKINRPQLPFTGINSINATNNREQAQIASRTSSASITENHSDTIVGSEMEIELGGAVDTVHSVHTPSLTNPFDDEYQVVSTHRNSPPKSSQATEDGWQNIAWQLMPETPVGRALVSATQRLESIDIDTAALDAQVILAHILGKNRAWLFAHHEYLLSEEEANQFTDCIVRRINREPVAYLIGRKEFYGLEFLVDHRVLIPRPETELLVDSVLSHLEMRSDLLAPGHSLSIADVGTGCGAIAVSVANNAPDVRVFATDISPDALEIARTNIRRLDDRCQVSLLHGDLLQPLANKVDMETVDIIVANLPYINSTDYAGLEPDVRNFEPQLALEAGPQGLDTIRRLLQQAPQHLNPNGVIMLEIGYDQGEAVVELAKAQIPQARMIDLRQDYNGKDRIVTIEF